MSDDLLKRAATMADLFWITILFALALLWLVLAAVSFRHFLLDDDPPSFGWLDRALIYLSLSGVGLMRLKEWMNERKV